MRLYEFESKQLLREEGIPVPDSLLISGELSDFGDRLIPGIMKVQTLSGRRLKRGGIEEVATVEAAQEFGARLLGRSFGRETVQRVLLEELIDSQEEYYLAVTYDTRARQLVVVFSRKGGVNVDELAEAEPEAIHRLPFSLKEPFRTYHAVEWLSGLGFGETRLKVLADLVTGLIAIFLRFDCLLLEVNPLARTAASGFVALDCHMEIDDDSLQRLSLPDFIDLSKPRGSSRELTVLERRAKEIDEIDYRGVAGRVIEFSGDLGLLIGGGGASLTTFDSVRDGGGNPANYCEIGGNPTVRKVKELTKLLVSQAKVRKLAVIMNVVSNTRADLVARGVIKGIFEAGREPRDVIAVFRVPGSGEEECLKILTHYGVPFSGREVAIDEAVRMALAE